MGQLVSPSATAANFIAGVMEFFSREVRQPDEALLEMMVDIGRQISQFLRARRLEKLLHEREREFKLAPWRSGGCPGIATRDWPGT